MDFDDFEQENQNCNYADDDYDQGNDPEISSVTRTVNEALKSAPAKRQKSGGKKQGAVWDLSYKSAEKHNASHYWATCRACADKGYSSAGKVNGVATAMEAHLKKCPNLTDAEKAGYGASASSKAAVSSGSQQHFNQFLPLKDTPHDEPEQAELDALFLRATISGNLPYVWLQDEHVVNLLKFLKLSILIPSRKRIAGTLLNNEHELQQGTFRKVLSEDPACSLSFDGWKDISRSNLLAWTVTTAKLRKAFTYEVQDVSGDRKTGEAVALLARAQIKLLEDIYHANVIAKISDAAGEAAKARRLVQQAMPHIISLNCFSHQMNLIVGDYFKKTKGRGHEYQNKVSLLIMVLTWWITHPVAYAKLMEKQQEKYGKTFKLKLPCLTRWGSHVDTMDTALDSSQAIKSLVCDSRQFLEEVSKAEKKAVSETTITVLDACETPQFWRDIETVRDHLKPLKIATKALEADAATLDLVLTMLGHLYKHCSQIQDPKVREVLTASLEDRWQACDQRIFLLGYMLNPAWRLKHLNSTCDFASATNAACLLDMVYEELFGDVLSELTDHFVDYLHGGESPFTERTLESMSANTRKPRKLWTFVQKDENAKALARIALRLFGVSVNSASTERHFSQAGIIHNKLRNRLGHKKVTKMVQVRAMLRADQPKRVKNVRKAQQQPGGEHETDQTALLTEGASTSETADLDLLDTITNQGDFDEAVNDWLFDLELEDLASGKPRDVAVGGVVIKAPLSCIFGSSLEVLSESNVDKV